MGLKDYYVPAIKGAIYAELPDAKIVDISHDIPSFDISQASFVLKNCYSSFPKGTIHIVGVDPEPKNEKRNVALEYDGYYFIGNDNGIFSLMFDKVPTRVFELTIHSESTFLIRDKFVPAACHLARGGTLEVIGTIATEFNRMQPFRAVVEGNVIRGTVIYIDKYGNVITNVTQQLFADVGRNNPFSIYFRRSSYEINRINRTFNEVPEGEKVAMFTSGGHLQIAINKGGEGSGGGANKLFGLKLNDIITVEFESQFIGHDN